MIKAIFIDFDGTLYSHVSGGIPNSAVKGIKELLNKGYKVFLCTGRSKKELEQFDLKGLKFSGGVLNNGQVLVDENFNILKETYLEGELKDKVLAIFNNKRIPTTLLTTKSFYLNFDNELTEYIKLMVKGAIPPIGTYQGEDIIGASMFAYNCPNQKEIKELDQIGEITYWFDNSIDVSPLGVNKANGIKELEKLYGFTIEETMGIGDGNNDISMLKECGIGVAMGNGDLDAKNAADYITSDIDEDGLYNCFKHYKLI